MKNLKKILILLILFIPIFVNADMGAPVLREFEIVVVNPNGVDYTPYQYSDVADPHLAKDTIVYVKAEYNGTYEIGVKDSDTIISIGTIDSLDGFSIVQEEVDPTKTENDKSIIKYDSKQKAIVNNENGVDILQGPSTVYKKVGTIKKGTELEYEYAIKGESGITYIYVTYDGKKGWVDILNENVLISNNQQDIFRNDVSRSCGTIPNNTITTPNYRTDSWSRKALFEYNDCKVLLNIFRSEDVLLVTPGTQDWPSNYKTLKDVNVYETADTSSKLVGTIPAGTEVVMLACVDEMTSDVNVQYIDYNGMRGWSVGNPSEMYEHVGGTLKDIKVEDTLKLKANTDEKKVEVKKDNNKNNNSKILGLSSKEFVIVCAAAGVLLSLTGVIIIVLINKKKNTKKNKINEEIKNVEEVKETANNNNIEE